MWAVDELEWLVMKQHIAGDDFKDHMHAAWIYNFLKVRKWLSEPIHTEISGLTPSKYVPILKPFHELSETEVRQEVLRSLNNSHRKFILNGGQRLASVNLFRQLTDLYERSKLQPSDYNFVTKLIPRTKKLIWLYIRNLHAHESVQGEIVSYAHLNNGYMNFIHYLPQEPIYPFYTLTAYPLTLAEMTESITDFLNFWEANAALKREHLENFRRLIQDVQTFNTAFRWLSPEDTNQCEWAYSYLKYRKILQDSYPVGAKGQYYDAIVASFDYWNSSYEAKKLLLKDMSQAWSTKKFRDKQVGKKPYNFIMSKKISKMLDNLADDGELSKSEIVEQLIAQAHSDLQDNKSKP